MRVLIAGATGFVGRALAPELLEDGLEVRCLVRSRDSEAARRARASTGCELVEGDVTDPTARSSARSTASTPPTSSST